MGEVPCAEVEAVSAAAGTVRVGARHHLRAVTGLRQEGHYQPFPSPLSVIAADGPRTRSFKREDGRVLGQECGPRRAGGRGDEPVEWIAGPRKRDRCLHDGGETAGVDGEPDFLRKFVHDVLTGHFQLSDFVKVGEFQEDHRRDDWRGLLQQCGDEWREA